MIEESGARLQEAMRETPWLREHMQVTVPLRGIIKRVYFKNDKTNLTHQTVADITMLGGYSDLRQVPFMSMKSRAHHGEEWTPEPGDNVVVQFIGGRWSDPIVTGHLPNPDNDIQATTEEAPDKKRRYYRKCNKTDLTIDKDGNRVENVEKDEIVTVKGHETLTVKTGDYSITVEAGKCTVYVKGKTTWKSDGTIEHDGGSGSVKGVVQGDCICPYTRKPHVMISSNVKASR